MMLEESETVKETVDTSKNLVITITNTFTGGLPDDEHTVYEIELWNTESKVQQQVQRRFSQFLSLCRILGLFFSDETLPRFPVNKVIKKMDPKIIEIRQHQLQQYLRELQMYHHVFQSFHVKLFLNLISVDRKVCIVTGANAGIGKHTAMQLAKFGMHVILACRSEKRALPVVEEIKKETGNNLVEYMNLDLASLHSVRDFASKFKESGLPLNVLILNAGCLGELQLTQDGFESSFGVNYLGHFLLTKLLLDLLNGSADALNPSRIVVVASDEHYNSQVQSIPYEKVHTQATVSTALEAYQVSKLACLIFAEELSRRLKDTPVTVTSVSPGFVATNLFRKLPSILDWLVKQFSTNIEDGARPILFCAVSEEMKGVSGNYIGANCKRKFPNRTALKPEVGITLWSMSESWVSSAFQDRTLGLGFEGATSVSLEKKEEQPQKSNRVQEEDHKAADKGQMVGEADVSVAVDMPDTEVTTNMAVETADKAVETADMAVVAADMAVETADKAVVAADMAVVEEKEGKPPQEEEYEKPREIQNILRDVQELVEEQKGVGILEGLVVEEKPEHPNMEKNHEGDHVLETNKNETQIEKREELSVNEENHTKSVPQ